MHIAHIRCVLFELCLMNEKERKKMKYKIDNFMFNFLDCEEKSWDSGAIFDIRIAKSFHLPYSG